jgi:DNA-binding MarR family transcriptional regulator
MASFDHKYHVVIYSAHATSSHGYPMKHRTRDLAKTDFEQLSEFRYQMRRFERFSEQAAQGEGITPLQYLLLLHIKGYPGREWATIGELAERLQAQHHGVVALVSRCEAIELVERRVSERDRRQVEVHLLPAGEALLARLAELHRAELRTLDGRFTIPQIDL